MRETSNRRKEPNRRKYEGPPEGEPKPSPHDWQGPNGVYCPDCQRIVSPRQINHPHSTDGRMLKPWNRCPSYPVEETAEHIGQLPMDERRMVLPVFDEDRADLLGLRTARQIAGRYRVRYERFTKQLPMSLPVVGYLDIPTRPALYREVDIVGWVAQHRPEWMRRAVRSTD